MIETRTQLIQYLIDKHQYKTYLEIGVFKGYNFRDININKKEWVDPTPRTKDRTNGHIMTSDVFFNTKEKTSWDIIFIDGLHTEEQSTKDLNNSLNHLNFNGCVILHDCNPPDVRYESFNLCGTVWKTIVKFRKRDDLLVRVIDIDFGCGYVKKLYDYKYDMIDKNKKEMLNLISIDELNNIT
jgi:hypothetical protein